MCSTEHLKHVIREHFKALREENIQNLNHKYLFRNTLL